MKFNVAAAAVSAALLSGVAHADEPVASSVSVDIPTFTPATNVDAAFLEQFTDESFKRWKRSKAKKDTKGSEENWAYDGEWAIEEPKVYQGMKGDKGLVVKNAARHHAISAKFPKKIDNKGKTLVVQYEVKLQKGLECGGAYLKLLRDNKALHREEFSNVTPYVIMFGPDKCGSNNKVHFIFNHKNPKTQEYEEKHFKSPPLAKIAKTTELYTLIVHPNNTFAIHQNGIEIKSGSLLEDFEPPVNPPKEINDPNDSKPDDWVDEARIPDPKATKPDDWDEEAPFEIVDEDATKPDDWLEDEPHSIPDPESQKPEDWNDEEDGDWIAPTITNPKCGDISGCGPWQKPLKKNPDYKGKWTAPFVDNPAYKGVWAPRKIKNPDYFEDKTPANFEPMGAIGFEIWTMQEDILFDNIYIGHSIEEAKKFADQTFALKHTAEMALVEADEPKSDEPKSPSDIKFLKNPVLFIQEKAYLFATIAQRDILEAIRFVPEVAAGIGAIIVSLIAIIFGLVGKSSSSAPTKKPATTDTKKDKAVEATATGADKANKGEATKRTTRSQN